MRKSTILSKKVIGISIATAAVLSLSGITPSAAKNIAVGEARVLEGNLAGQSLLLDAKTGLFDHKNGPSTAGPSQPLGEPLPGLIQLGIADQQVKTFRDANGWGTDSSASTAGLTLDLAQIDGSELVDLPPTTVLLDSVVTTLNLEGLSEGQLEELLGLPSGGLGGLLGQLPIGSTLDDLITEIENVVNGLGDEIAPVLQDALDSLDTTVQLETGEIRSEAHAVLADNESTVVAGGESLVADGHISARLLGQDLPLVDLPSGSDANTQFTASLDAVVALLQDEVLDDVVTQLDEALGTELTGIYAPLLDEVRDSLISQLDTALEPLFTALNDAVIQGHVNKQVPVDGGIEVTALEVNVLPAAAQQFGVNLLDVKVARSLATAFPAPADQPDPEDPRDPEDPEDPRDPRDPRNPDPRDPDDDTPPRNDPDLPDIVKSGK